MCEQDKCVYHYHNVRCSIFLCVGYDTLHSEIQEEQSLEYTFPGDAYLFIGTVYDSTGTVITIEYMYLFWLKHFRYYAKMFQRDVS